MRNFLKTGVCLILTAFCISAWLIKAEPNPSSYNTIFLSFYSFVSVFVILYELVFGNFRKSSLCLFICAAAAWVHIAVDIFILHILLFAVVFFSIVASFLHTAKKLHHIYTAYFVLKDFPPPAQNQEKLKKLQEAYDKLLDEHNASRNLMMNVSHDLRTPISIIKGYIEVLADGLYDSDEEEQEYLSRIHEKIVYLNNLVNDLFLLTKLEDRKLTLNKELLNLNTLISKILEDLEQSARNKNNEFIALLEGNLERPVDGIRFNQVVQNIVDNAIKFTENGTITIQTSLLENSLALITITDTGIGIAPDVLENLFTKPQTNFIYSGGNSTGLGLRICRELVLYHGGAIWAESKLGKGTTVYIKI